MACDAHNHGPPSHATTTLKLGSLCRILSSVGVASIGRRTLRSRSVTKVALSALLLSVLIDGQG